jgi:hypothetical protein
VVRSVWGGESGVCERWLGWWFRSSGDRAGGFVRVCGGGCRRGSSRVVVEGRALVEAAGMLVGVEWGL